MRQGMRNFLYNLHSMFKAEWGREIGYLKKDRDQIRAEARILRGNAGNDRDNLDYLKKRVDAIYEGLGGLIWRTQAGHTRFLAILSSEHLENIKLWPSATPQAIHLCNKELERRRIDAEFRRKETPEPSTDAWRDFAVALSADVEARNFTVSLATKRLDPRSMWAKQKAALKVKRRKSK